MNSAGLQGLKRIPNAKTKELSTKPEMVVGHHGEKDCGQKGQVQQRNTQVCLRELKHTQSLYVQKAPLQKARERELTLPYPLIRARSFFSVLLN